MRHVSVGSRFVYAVLAGAVLLGLWSRPCQSDDWKGLAKKNSFWAELKREHGAAAGAVMLLEEAETRVRIERGYSQTKTYYTYVAAILDPVEAYELGEWRVWKLPSSAIGDISANTYLKSGKKVSVRSDDVREAKSGDATVYEFALPHFKENCIVEVKYWIANEGWFVGTEWLFGGSHPTQVSRLRLLFPAWIAEISASDWPQAYAARRAVPKPKFDREFTTDGDVVSFTWELKDLPGVREEPYMPPVRDLVPAVKIGATQKGFPWDQACRWYFETYLMERLDPKPEIKQLAMKLSSGKGSREARLRSLYDYVRKNVRYTDIPLTKSGICPKHPETVLRNANGDCKDQATLLVALAGAIGLPAKCALVRTRDLGEVEERITDLGAFNHMIAVADLDGAEYWLDPTATPCPFGELPLQDQGVRALVIDEGGDSGFRTTPVSGPGDNSTMTWTTAVLGEDGSIEAEIRMCPKGQHASGWRHVLSTAKDEDIQRYLNYRCKGAEIKEWSAEGGEMYGADLELRCSFEKADFATVAEDIIVLKPAVYSEPDLCNRFSGDRREYPINMLSMACWVDSVTVVIPDGYGIQEPPEPVRLEGPLGEFEMSLAVHGDELRCYRRFEIDTLVCGKHQYPDLREFLGRIRKCCGKGIVLKKV